MTQKILSTQLVANKGCWVERGIATIIPAATGVITANLNLETPFDDSISCNVGDQIFVQARGGNKAGEIVGGARVTAQGVAKVQLYNVTGTNITDSNAQTFDYILIHYS